MELLLGIDLGTSYFKVGLFDSDGTMHGLGRVAVAKGSPVPGRSELSVAQFWLLIRQALDEALAGARATPRQITAVSYSSQANSFLLLDGQGAALTPLVLWADARAGAVPDDLAAFARSPEFQAAVGCENISPAFAVCKWRWFQREQPAVWSRTRRVMMISDYFSFALTGEGIGDSGTAALLGLCDLQRGGWWPDALAAAGVEEAMLSRLRPPGSPAGFVSPEGAGHLGIPAGIPFAVGSLDHHVAAIGSGLGFHAELSISTGTVLAALAIIDRLSLRPGCYHGPHFAPGRYFRLAFDPAGAGQLEDYQCTAAPEASIDQLIILAAARYPSLTGSAEAARASDADARHGAATLAILESIAQTHRRLVAAVSGHGEVNRIVATGGGSRSAFWLQVKADVLGVPIIVPVCPERACLGAAIFAAVACGAHKTISDALAAMTRIERTFMPAPRHDLI